MTAFVRAREVGRERKTLACASGSSRPREDTTRGPTSRQQSLAQSRVRQLAPRLEANHATHRNRRTARSYRFDVGTRLSAGDFAVNTRLVVPLTVAAITCAAHAQWTVTNLHPAGATESWAYAVSDGKQAGFVIVGGVTHAVLWNGAAASWADLHPAGATSSEARAVNSLQQAGFAIVDGFYRASLWSDTAASRVDLHPVGARHSLVYAASGEQLAGIVSFAGGMERASLWSGTAASWVDLNPEGATRSLAMAANGGQQAGWAVVDGVGRACLWSGTAASWVDLHPAGSAQSEAYGIDGGRQVGRIRVGGTTRASLWNGTAASWVDLNPVGATTSEAYAVSGGQQVGVAQVGGVYRASLWSGTAASWVDLHALLPAEFSSSVAFGISSNGVNTHVVGFARPGLFGPGQALLWTYTPCAADFDNDGDFANGLTRDGEVTIEDLLSFLVGFEAGNVLVDLDNGTYTGTPDNAVDINDLLFFLARFEAGC